MSEALDPIQPDLPLEMASAGHPAGAKTPEAHEQQPASIVPLPSRQQEEPPASIIEPLWARVRGFPWAATGRLLLAVLAYGYQLARATPRLNAVQRGARWLATAIHIAGFPAVVVRTALQATLVHRAGLTLEEAVFFRADDPAGFVVYEPPPEMGSAAAIALVPSLVLTVLAVICLGPATSPRSVLHLPTTWLTGVELWLGLAFATHILPASTEATSLAEQAWTGVRQAQPLAIIWVLPCQFVGVVTRFGGLLPALIGGIAVYWLAGALFLR